MTEDLSGEVFSDWARVVSTTSDSLCFFFKRIAMACTFVFPKKGHWQVQPSKGMVLLSEGGNNRCALAAIRPRQSGFRRAFLTHLFLIISITKLKQGQTIGKRIMRIERSQNVGQQQAIRRIDTSLDELMQRYLPHPAIRDPSKSWSGNTMSCSARLKKGPFGVVKKSRICT